MRRPDGLNGAGKPANVSGGVSRGPTPPRSFAAFSRMRCYDTRLLSLKIGRMIDIAMKPTMLPISTIMSGSIIDVMPLMTDFSSAD